MASIILPSLNTANLYFVFRQNYNETYMEFSFMIENGIIKQHSEHKLSLEEINFIRENILIQ